MTSFSTPPVFADDKSTKISNSLNDSIAPSIATDGTNIYITWTDQSRSGPGEIFFSKSADGGQTFSAPKNISNKQGDSIAPFLAINGTDIYVTWTYRYPNNPSGGWSDDNSEIYLSKSTDGGKTFSVPQRISEDSSFSSGSKMVIEGNNIFVTWFTITRDGNSYKNMEIYLSKSTDGGKTFSVPLNISNNEGFSDSQSIATDGINIFVAWSDEHMDNTAVFLTKSTDGGQTFTTPQNISNNMRYSDSPSIAIDGSNIFIVWTYQIKGENHDILFSKSTDGGQTFAEPQNISNTNGFSTSPSIAIDGSNIFVTWVDGQTKSSPILFSKSIDGGLTFSPPQTISNNTGFSSSPSIATDGINIFNAWSWAARSDDRQDLLFSKLMIESSPTKDNSETLEGTNSASPQPDQSKEPDVSNDTSSVKSIRWLDENGANYTPSGIGIIRMDNSDLNVNKQLMDIPVVHVWSDTDKNGIPVDMIETGADTGVFYADITLSGIESSHLQLHVSNGDTMTASFEDKSLDEPLVDTVKIISKYLSPREQLESGTHIDQIQCQEGLMLAKNARTGDPLCLKPQTLSKLKERNWIQ
ncbi:MAG TPA: sialidase family protein [Candidatus Binatia bacterium]|nr:sialidase family protein [Candidatus Binatia bacterium]